MECPQWRSSAGLLTGNYGRKPVAAPGWTPSPTDYRTSLPEATVSDGWNWIQRALGTAQWRQAYYAGIAVIAFCIRLLLCYRGLWPTRSRMPDSVNSLVWAAPSPRRPAGQWRSPSRKPTRTPQTPLPRYGLTRLTSRTTGHGVTGMVSSRCRPRPRLSGPIWRRPARATRCPHCAAVSRLSHGPVVSLGSHWTPSIRRSARRSEGSAASMAHQPDGQLRLRLPRSSGCAGHAALISLAYVTAHCSFWVLLAPCGALNWSGSTWDT